MLLNLYFENFRSFKDPVHLTFVAESSKAKEQNVFVQRIKKIAQEDELRLLKSVVIYGANASGKSNLIRGVRDILLFACDFHATAGEPIDAYTPFAFDKKVVDAPVKFTIEFIGQEDIKFKYELTYNRTLVIFESLTWWPHGKQATIFERRNDESDDALTHKIKITAQKQEELEIFRNQTVLSKFGNQEADNIISRVYLYLYNIDIVTPLNVGGSRLERDRVSHRLFDNSNLMKKMNELLRFADTGLKFISVEKLSSERRGVTRVDENRLIFRRGVEYKIDSFHKMYEDGKYLEQDTNLPFVEESNGVKTLYTFGGRILSVLETGGAIFVDELETSLHPYLSKLLVLLFQNERINKKNAQLIFTTHDTNLLERSIFRKDQIWFAQKNEYGITDLYSLQDFSDVREDTPFDKWYLAGKFGGIPDLKSLENLFEDI